MFHIKKYFFINYMYLNDKITSDYTYFKKNINEKIKNILFIL